MVPLATITVRVMFLSSSEMCFETGMTLRMNQADLFRPSTQIDWTPPCRHVVGQLDRTWATAAARADRPDTPSFR